MIDLCIGLDPGETTGWFEIYPHGATFYAQLERNQVRHALRDRIERLSYGNVLVGCERFVISSETAKKAPEDGANDMIGVIKDTCGEYDHCELVFSMPSDKTRVPDSMLKKLGWWVPGQNHAMDGARHGLLAIANRDLLLFGKLVDHVVL